MFTQADIDAVLNQAQDAVESLAADVGRLTEKPDATPAAQPVALPAAPQVAASTPTAQGTHGASSPGGPVPAPRAALTTGDALERILKIRVPVVVRLAERPMLLHEVLKVVPGTILEFARTVDEELDLLANNHQIGSGVAVKVNERFGLRVTYVGDVRQRIASLRSA